MDPKPKSSYSPSNQPPVGQWTTGLYDCRDDPSNCWLSCFCPCIPFGQMAEVVDAGTTSANAQGCIYFVLGNCRWIYGSMYRSKLRRLFSLPEAPYSDCLVHACCCVCSLSQEYRELNNRGVDPTLGWDGNVEKWKREGVTPPIVAPPMGLLFGFIGLTSIHLHSVLDEFLWPNYVS